MERTHRVQLYDPPASDNDPYAPGEPGWTKVGTELQANLQPLTGSVQQSAAGRQVEATWKGFLPAGTVVREDMGVVVLTGPGPLRYRVRQVGAHPPPWDTEVLLGATNEEIAEAAP